MKEGFLFCDSWEDVESTTGLAIDRLEVNEYMSAYDASVGCAIEVSILADEFRSFDAPLRDERLSSRLGDCCEESNSLIEGRGFFEAVEGSKSLSFSFRFPDDLDEVAGSETFPLRALVI